MISKLLDYFDSRARKVHHTEAAVKDTRESLNTARTLLREEREAIEKAILAKSQVAKRVEKLTIQTAIGGDYQRKFGDR